MKSNLSLSCLTDWLLGEQVKIASLGSKVEAMNTRVRLRCNGNLNEKNITVTSFRITKKDSDCLFLVTRFMNIQGSERQIYPSSVKPMHRKSAET